MRTINLVEMDDEYFTITKQSQGLYKEKGSKFISYLTPVLSIEEIENELNLLKKEHPKSRHICYAYRLGYDGQNFRVNDDGEPSGTAGRPIYNSLLSAKITNGLCAVVRYFGGTKLGASGLINAYKVSSREAVAQNTIVQKYITQDVKLIFDISEIGKVYNSLKQVNLSINDQGMESKSWIRVSERKSLIDEKVNKFLAHFHDISLDYVLHDSFTSRIKIEHL